MCQFNTVVFSKQTDLNSLNGVFREHDFTPLQVNNESLDRQLPDKLFIISTRHQCDCGSVISSARYKDSPASSQDKEIKKLKRKGWSDTKINNYLGNKSRAGANKVDNIAEDRERWNKLIKTAFTNTNLKNFGILAHEYSGDISIEVINILSKQRIKLNEFKPEQLDEFQMDTYYEIQT